MLFEVGLIFLLLLINGFFAMAELAVVSASMPRLESLAAAGDRGAKKAIELARDPGRLLSSVQIGITLVGIFAGAFSGAILAGPLAEVLARVPILEPAAQGLSLFLVVGSITYLSLVIGELVPKRLALAFPEKIAVAVSRPLGLIARFSSPLVRVLEISTRGVLRLLSVDKVQAERVSEEEVKAVIAAGTRAGILDPAEQKMIQGVMRLADRRVTALMTPRHDIEWIDLEDPAESIRAMVLKSRRSRLPVAKGKLECMVGVVSTRDVLEQLVTGDLGDLETLARPVPMLHDRAPALAALEVLRHSPSRIAMIVDEHGALEGLVTVTDVLETIIGLMREQDGGARIVRRDDRSWLIDGDTPVDQVGDAIRCPDLGGDGSYATLAGFLLSKLEHLPRTGQVLDWKSFRFEVVDMDVFRIDKVLVTSVTEGGDHHNLDPRSASHTDEGN